MNQPKITPVARAVASVLAGSIFMLQPATASLPDTHIFNDADEISDAELSDMRGRYVGPGEILYFGVEMYTQWTTKDGTIQNTPGVNLTMNQNFQPTVTIVTPNTSSQPGTAPVTPAGIGNISGVGQSIQIGGDGNSIKNDFSINISHHASGGASPNGIVLNGTGSTTVGDTTVTLSGNSLSMAVNVGQDHVLQQIKGGQGFLQSAQVGSDMNQIHNIITVNAGLSSPPGLANTGLRSAMDALRGLRF